MDVGAARIISAAGGSLQTVLRPPPSRRASPSRSWAPVVNWMGQYRPPSIPVANPARVHDPPGRNARLMPNRRDLYRLGALALGNLFALALAVPGLKHLLDPLGKSSVP